VLETQFIVFFFFIISLALPIGTSYYFTKEEKKNPRKKYTFTKNFVALIGLLSAFYFGLQLVYSVDELGSIMSGKTVLGNATLILMGLTMLIIATGFMYASIWSFKNKKTIIETPRGVKTITGNITRIYSSFYVIMSIVFMGLMLRISLPAILTGVSELISKLN
jgi:hypothetical protein